MNLLHLEYLIEVQKHGSISKAAKHLYLNQPHLSKIIKEFETQMNFKIFERTSKGVVPTKKGLEFLNKAKVLVTQAKQLENEYYNDNKEIMELNICIPRASYISETFVKCLENELNNDYELSINYQETNSIETIKHVFEGEDNLGVIRFPIADRKYFENILKHKDLSYEELFSFNYRLIMSKDNPLVSKEITLNDLKDQIVLLHGDIEIPGMPLSDSSNLSNDLTFSKSINIYERASQFEILDKVKNSYMWVSPIPKKMLERFNLVQKECKDNHIKCVDLLIYRKGYTFNQGEKEFIQELNKTISKI